MWIHFKACVSSVSLCCSECDSQTLNSEDLNQFYTKVWGLSETPELRVLRSQVCSFSCREGISLIGVLRTCWIDTTLHEVMATGTLGIFLSSISQIKCSAGQGKIRLCTLEHSMKLWVPPGTGYSTKLVEWLTSFTSLALCPHDSESPGIGAFKKQILDRKHRCVAGFWSVAE